MRSCAFKGTTSRIRRRKVIKRVAPTRRSTRRLKKCGPKDDKLMAGQPRRTAGADLRKERTTGAQLFPGKPACSTPPIVHRLVGDPAVIGAIGQLLCRVPAQKKKSVPPDGQQQANGSISWRRVLRCSSGNFEEFPAQARRHSHRRARYCRASMAAAPHHVTRGTSLALVLEVSRMGSWRVRTKRQ